MQFVIIFKIVLIQFCLLRCINGMPTDSETIQIETVRNDVTNDTKSDDTYYVSKNSIESIAPTNDNLPTKRGSEKLKIHQLVKRKRGHRRANYRVQPDCRPTEIPVVKPTKIYIQMPNMFISQSWGPGR